MIVNNRFHTPQRQAFGIGGFGLPSSGESAPAQSPEETVGSLRTKLAEKEEKLKEVRSNGNILGCAFLLACGAIIGIMLNEERTETKMQEKQAQTTALLSEATGGKINAKNLDKAIEARQADSLAGVASRVAQAAAQKADSLKNFIRK